MSGLPNEARIHARDCKCKPGAEMLQETERLKKLLDRDHTGLASGLDKVRAVARGYRWIPAGELGCYTAPGCGEGTELTKERLLEEVGFCLDEIERVARVAITDSGARAAAAFFPEVDQLAAAVARAEKAERERDEARETARAFLRHARDEDSRTMALASLARRLALDVEDWANPLVARSMSNSCRISMELVVETERLLGPREDWPETKEASRG